MPLLAPRFTTDLSGATKQRILAAYSNTMPFRFGEKSDGVRVLQQALIDLFSITIAIPSGATGNFFQETRDAVIAFQRSVGIPTDGEAGHDTLHFLDLCHRNRKDPVWPNPPVGPSPPKRSPIVIPPLFVGFLSNWHITRDSDFTTPSQPFPVKAGLLALELQQGQGDVYLLACGVTGLGVGKANPISIDDISDGVIDTTLKAFLKQIPSYGSVGGPIFPGRNMVGGRELEIGDFEGPFLYLKGGVGIGVAGPKLGIIFLGCDWYGLAGAAILGGALLMGSFPFMLAAAVTSAKAIGVTGALSAGGTLGIEAVILVGAVLKTTKVR